MYTRLRTLLLILVSRLKSMSQSEADAFLYSAVFICWSVYKCMSDAFLRRSEIKEWKGRDVWPSMVTHTRNLCSAFNPSKCNNKHTHTPPHTENTHPEQWACILYCGTRGAVGGSVPCSRAPQSWYWGRALYIHSPHLQFLPNLRLEPMTFGLQVRLSIH